MLPNSVIKTPYYFSCGLLFHFRRACFNCHRRAATHENIFAYRAVNAGQPEPSAWFRTFVYRG